MDPPLEPSKSSQWWIFQPHQQHSQQDRVTMLNDYVTNWSEVALSPLSWLKTWRKEPPKRQTAIRDADMPFDGLNSSLLLTDSKHTPTGTAGTHMLWADVTAGYNSSGLYHIFNLLTCSFCKLQLMLTYFLHLGHFGNMSTEPTVILETAAWKSPKIHQKSCCWLWRIKVSLSQVNMEGLCLTDQ